jgi:hypothetical protein
MQHASAVGCAMAALIAGRACDAPAIDAFSPRRLAEGRPLAEHNVI